MGNSLYVQKRIRERYALGNAPYPNARDLHVRVAPEPQLVVCKGIVADRIAKLKSGRSVLEWRCSRASYGTLCKVLYNSNDPQHFGQPTQQDPLDKKLYIPNAVDWIIKQVARLVKVIVDRSANELLGRTSLGGPATCNSVQKEMRPSESFRSQPDSGVPDCRYKLQSRQRTSPLHQNFWYVAPLTCCSKTPNVSIAACETICEIQSDFSTLPLTQFKLKNRHWWNSGAKYHRIDYVVKVAIGPADIRFELWHNGQKLSKDNSIKVEWSAAEAPVEQPTVDSGDQWLPTTSRVWTKGVY